MSSRFKYDHECFDNNASFIKMPIVNLLIIFSTPKIQIYRLQKYRLQYSSASIILIVHMVMSKLSEGYKYRKSTSIRHFEQCNQ